MKSKPRPERETAIEEQIAQLEAAIAAQKALRHTLGDATVETVVAALREKLDALRARQRTAAPSANQITPERLLERLRSYLPQGLADKMRATGSIEGERRQVTILFADLSGFTALSERLDPEDVITLTNAVLKELAEAVYQYEGYVDKFLGDGLMAVFGAPVAHEDDPERALRSALAMRERLERLDQRWIDFPGRPFSIHIGINTGMVIVGTIGSDLRMSYTVMGDTVNTASRLEGASTAGQILVSYDTYRLTREAFTFRALEPIRVKGKQERLAVYELQRARLVPSKTRGLRDLASAFVGREEEMAQLRAVMDDLQAGQGHIVVVSGEAGIGKSRLMAEWQQVIARDERSNWMEGRCLAYTATVSYGPFLELIRRYARIKEGQSEDIARRQLDAVVERFFPQDAEAKAIFANLLALRFSPQESDMLASLPAEQLRQRLFNLIVVLFTRLATERPTVLVIEDMHWADASSLELVEHLLPLVERLPFAVVGVSRQWPGPGDKSLFAAVHARYADRFTAIVLLPLSEASSLEMVTQLLTTDDLPPSLKGLIADKAEGNPFFVEEVIRMLIEQGALVRAEDGTWEVTTLIETVAVPDTLHGLLMARLDRLPAETKWLAQQAAVIGRIFLYRVLRHIADGGEDLDASLSRLELDQLIRERVRDPELEYMFRHALTQEVAYQSLLTPRRKELHRRVGEVMEELFAERIAEFTAIIGGHLLRGEAWERAFDHLIQAGDAAARLCSHAEARLHYGGALEALTHLSDTQENRRRHVDTLIKQVRSSRVAASSEENLAHLAEAERLAQELIEARGASVGDRLRLARVRYWIGFVYYTRGAMREAIGYFRQVLSVAQELSDAELLAIASFAIGLPILMQGHFGQAMALHSQAMKPLEQLGNWSDWIRAVGYHGMALTATGKCKAGLAEIRRALARAREINSLSEIAFSNLPLAFTYLTIRDLPRAIEAARQAVEAGERSGDRLLVYVGHGIQGWAEGLVGRYEAATASMVRSQAVAQELGGRVLVADWFVAAGAEIAFCAGRIEEALAVAKQAVSMAQKWGNIFAEGIARRVWGQALAVLTPPMTREAERARWDEVEAQLTQSLHLLESGQARLEAARTRVVWGVICRHRGHFAAAREHCEQSAAQFEVSGLTDELERTRALIAALPET